MTFGKRLKGVGIALAIVILTAPLALFIGLISVPLLRWLEMHYPIEVIGHSGPADWVFIAIYVVLIIVAGILWSFLIRK